ncbi:MAG TPA: hypothetical protein VKB76_00460 [Ktedonobacterales bacterium]|nr:hypothetical protein [Ktedonobacterales bacterium]
MSSRYEREIEEILRKSDVGRPSVGDRIRAMNQRPPSPRRGFRLTLRSETWLMLGILLAFGSATVHWYFQESNDLTNWIAGGLALAGLALIVATMIASWAQQTRGPQMSFRGRTVDRGGPRRTPFSSFLIRLNLIKMRLDYRKEPH